MSMRQKYDVMILGPATRDCNMDYDGMENRCIGGAVTFCAAAAKSTGAGFPLRGSLKEGFSFPCILFEIEVPYE